MRRAGYTTAFRLLVLVALAAVFVTLTDGPAFASPGTFASPWLPQQTSGSAAGHGHKSGSSLQGGKGAHRPTPPGALPNRPVAPRPSGAQPTVKNAKQTDARADDRSADEHGPEVVARRTATSSAYDNGDGTFTEHVYERPIHYQTPTGGWADIDTTLVRGADGSWREKANSAPVALAARSGGAPLVSMTLAGGGTVGFGIEGAASVTGVASGSDLTYPKIAKDTDARYTATAIGAKETLVLHSASAPSTWLFPLQLKGIGAVAGPSGSIEFVDTNGNVVGRIAAGFMEDSKVDPRSGDGAISGGVTYSLTTLRGAQALQVSLDSAWLHDPARVFPVMVDPSVANNTATSSTYVMSPFNTNYSGDSLLKVGTYDGGANVANSFVKFPINPQFTNDYILAATLDLDETWSYSCSPRPVYVAPTTSSWSASSVSTYPGPSHGAAIGHSNMAYGYSSSCAGPRWVSIDLGDSTTAAGTKLIENAAHSGGDVGLAIYADSGDSYGWKKFASVNSIHAPYLSITYSPYGADYSVPNTYVAPTTAHDGSQSVTVTNRGRDTWVPITYGLSYQLFDTSWHSVLTTGKGTVLPHNVAPNASVKLNAVIGAVAAGRYYLCWDMHGNGSSFNIGYKVPTSRCELIVSANTIPQVDSSSPLSNSVLDTLTPTLAATGHDPDDPTGAGMKFDFKISTVPTSGDPVLVADSGWITAGTWTVPKNKLSWNKNYSWTVAVQDGGQTSPTSWPAYLSLAVPQPPITSHLGPNSTAAGYDPGVGNYTTQATDASVATVGPALSVVRSYNSLDPRTTGMFGAGWSTAWDMTAVPDSDNSGNVVLTYPDGRTLRFGLNADGTTYTPPQGTYATLTKPSTGGYALTVRGGTTYTFGVPDGIAWKLSTITDAAGRSQLLAYGAGNQLSSVTNTAGNRTLSFTWTGSHVTQVATDPVTTGGQPLVWTYGYTGDTLTSACSPASPGKCTTYAYTSGNGSGSHYRTTVLDSQPADYWRLNDPQGTSAVDDVASNLGTRDGTYNATFAHNAGPLPGTPTTSATFGGSGIITLPDGLATHSGGYLTIELWFRGTAGGPLFGYQSEVLDGTTPMVHGGVPALYVGTDGKLRGELWPGASTRGQAQQPIATTGTVTDGAWHHVALSGAGNTQSLYLDGTLVGSAAGPIDPADMVHDQLGAAHVSTPGYWPGFGTANTSYYHGDIAEVAFYNHPLGAPAVAAHHTAGLNAATEITSVTTPNGVSQAQVQYDNVVDRTTQITDIHGGTWKLDAPETSGSENDYLGTVLASHPTRLWTLGDSSGPDAANTLSGNIAWGSDAGEYSGVTLGQAGPFADSTATAAGFSGASSRLTLPMPMDDYFSKNDAIALWFKASTAGGDLVHQWNRWLTVESNGELSGDYDGTGVLHTSTAVTDGKWHFAVLAIDYTATPTASETLYVDGTPVGTKACQSTQCGPLNTAGDAIVGGTSFTGSVADVALYANTPLTADAVSAMYQAGFRSSTNPTPVTRSTVVDPGDATTTYTYDTAHGGRLSAVTDPLQNTTNYGYDGNGFGFTVTSPDGDYTQTTRDARGNTLTSSHVLPSGTIATAYYTYPAAGTYADTDPRADQPLAYYNPESRGPGTATSATTFTYNAAGQQLTTTNRVGAVTTQTYTTGTEPAVGGGTEPAGLPATSKDPLNHVTSYTYDAAGDLAKVITPSGLTTTYGYDNLGRRTTQTQVSDAFPGGVTSTSTWDAANRLAITTGPATTDQVSGMTHTPQVSRAYDPDGNLLSATTSDTTGGDAARTTTNTYDTHDQLATTTDPLNRMTSFGYDPLGRHTSTTDPAGTTISYAYDLNGHQVETTLHGWTGNGPDPAAASDFVVSSRSYDPDGLLASDTDAMGRTTAYYYGIYHRLAEKDLLGFHNADGTMTTRLLAWYGHDLDGNVTESDLGDGQETYYTYDDAGRLTGIDFDPGAGASSRRHQPDTVTALMAPRCSCRPTGIDRHTTLAYNAADQVVNQTVTNRATTEVTDYGYDAIGDRTSQTVHNDRTDLVTTWTYDQRGLPVSTTDPRGNATGATPADYTTNYSYDAAGKLVTVIGPAVNAESGGAEPTVVHPIIEVGYNSFGEQKAVQDPNGNITTNTYDAAGQLLGVSQNAYVQPATGNTLTPTTSYTYTNLGQVASVTDPNGHTTAATYDQLGDLVRATLPSVGGQTPTWQASYDGDGEPLFVIDPTGAKTDATYDDLGEQLTATAELRGPNGAVTTATTNYTYTPSSTPVGYPTQITQPGGETTQLQFDHAGHLQASTDPTGNKTVYTYDADEQLTKTTLPDNTAVTNNYDPAGRLVNTSRLDHTGTTLNTTGFGYDLAGNQTTITDPAGHTTTTGYDAANRRVSLIEPVDGTSNIATAFGYDAAGNLTRYTSGNGNETTYTYNTLQLPESTIDPPVAGYTTTGDRTTTASYDANGNTVTIAHPGGVTESGSYDALNRLTSQSGTGAEASTATRTLGYDLDGRITAVSTPTGTDTYSYNDLGELTSAGGPSGTATMSYNGNGQLISRADSAGTTGYSYDPDGRVATVTDPLTNATASYTYNPVGQVKTVGYGTGSASQGYTYNDLHELTNQTLTAPGGATEASVTYGYDDNGQVASQATTGTVDAGNNTYTYDQAGRLTNWTSGAGSVDYGYDNDGNRTQNGSHTATYDARDEVVSTDTTQYTYTARGTLHSATTGSSTTNYGYDAFDQQITAGSTAYTYDGLGRLTTAGPSTFSYDDPSSTIVGDGAQRFTRTPDGQPVSIGTSGSASLALTNQHDDVTGLFSTSGTSLTGSTSYTPYGTPHRNGSTSNLGYQGGWTDPSTGDTATESRWYNPETGTFTSHDTIATLSRSSTTANPYTYGNDNPVTNNDPSGHLTECNTTIPSIKKVPVINLACTVADAVEDLAEGHPDDIPGDVLLGLLNLEYDPQTTGMHGGASLVWSLLQLGSQAAGYGANAGLGIYGVDHVPGGTYLGGASGGLGSGWQLVWTGHGWVAVPPPPPPGPNTPTVNARPQGQSGFAYETAQPGDNGPNSGPADSPVNTHTTGSMNPADLPTLAPYEPDMVTDAGPGMLGPLPPAQTQLDGAQCTGGFFRYNGEAWSRTSVTCSASAGTESYPVVQQGSTWDAGMYYRADLPTRSPAGTDGPSKDYQVQHAGPTEYRISGGGQKVWADGVSDDAFAVEAKFVGNPARSPYVPESDMPPRIRAMILEGQEREFARYGAAIADPSNPLVGLRVITNSKDAGRYFGGLMVKYGIPGKIIIR